MRVGMRYARVHLVRLLKETEVGKEITITRNGEPIATLVGYRMKKGKRKLGTAKGDFVVPEDFNDPLPNDIERTFWN